MPIRFKDSEGCISDTGLSETQLNLLAHAQAIELDIGSQCGGHGKCGGDRILIPAHAKDLFSPLTSHEQSHLSPNEIAQGYRLACQCFPEKPDLDLTIEIADLT